MSLNLDYREYRKKNDIYGTILYPAVMVAPVQKEILKYIFERDNVTSVFDPFVGSGTSLYEAANLSSKIDLLGSDINPLAYLITKTKLDGICVDTYDVDINRLINLISYDKSKSIHRFNNSKKWFREDIAIDLTKIRRAIKQISSAKNRRYFWVIFSDIVRKYSNTRSSTYKLHVKSENQIKNMQNDVIYDFINSVKLNSNKYKKVNSQYQLFKKDSLKLMKKLKNNCIDLIITSPPYGDNLTTVPYGQFSSLGLFWIDDKDLKLEGWELNNYSIIDRKSLGGMRTRELTQSEMNIMTEYLKDITEHKRQKVLNFFADYFDFLNEVSRIAKKYIVLTLGNRKVDNVTIELSKITKTYLRQQKFLVELDVAREIPYKRIPIKTSNVNDKPVKSMNKEHMIVFVNNQK